MKKLILYLTVITSLYAETIDVNNIEKFIYINPETNMEYKVEKHKKYGHFFLTSLKGAVCECEEFPNSIDKILYYIKTNKLVISRECGKLEIKSK